MVGAVNAGVTFGAWTGWLVGLAVALATRTEPADVFAADAMAEYAGAGAAAGGGRRMADPPAAWWAPTARTGEGSFTAAGTVGFPAGGMPPVVAGVEPGEPVPAAPPAPDPNATRELTTASGDPHLVPHPDATQAVGIPPRQDPDPDPDATTTIPEATPDATRQITLSPRLTEPAWRGNRGRPASPEAIAAVYGRYCLVTLPPTPIASPPCAWGGGSAREEAEADRAGGVVDVGVDQDDRLPGAEGRVAALGPGR